MVEKLAENHSAKMTYYLTKFDTAGDEVDRTNVVSQIVQVRRRVEISMKKCGNGY